MFIEGEFITCEHMRPGHPDKVCDQIADAIVDAALLKAAEIDQPKLGHPDHPMSQRFGIEVIAKNYLVLLTGEARIGPGIRAELDLDRIVRKKWTEIGYSDADKLVILNYIQVQQPELQVSSDRGGAGDQGVMIGYATIETPALMPFEHELARRLCTRIEEFGRSGQVDWICPDGKAQVTVARSGQVENIVLGVQHRSIVDGLSDPDQIQAYIGEVLIEQVVRPIVGNDITKDKVVINGTGSFAIGGPLGDAGVVGRKIVADAYGPRIAVGGGAFSGKDPSKVDRSGAYMARLIARTAVLERIENAKTMTVSLAYAIGDYQPKMISAVSDEGADLSEWVRMRFPDLSPSAIAERLDLWHTTSKARTWSYQEAASNGHFGLDSFPWERLQ